MSNNSEYELSVAEVEPRQRIGGFQLSPDGRWLSFLLQRDLHSREEEEKGGRKIKDTPVADLCLLPGGGGYPRPLTGTGDMSAPGSWSPDGKSLAFVRGEELQVLELTEAAGGEPALRGLRPLCKHKFYNPQLADKGDAYLTYPAWRPPAGDLLLFATRDGRETALRVVSLDGREQRELYSTRGTILGWHWSPDGKRVVFVTRDEDRLKGEICLLDFDSAELTARWEEEHYKYSLPAAAWAPGGELLVFRSNRSGWAKLWVASADGSARRQLTEGDWDDYSFRFSPDGRQLVYTSRAGQSVSGDDLWVRPLEQGSARRITRHPGVNSPLAWSADGRVYYWHTSPAEPGDVWAAAADDDAARGPTRLTYNASAELEMKLRPPREVVIENRGTKIPALVYSPVYHQEDKKYPAIMWIRGGPTGTCRYEFKPFYNWLANLGFIVVTPNYRGSTGCGVEHMRGVLGEGVGAHDLDDILATGRFIRDELPGVELARGIGIAGHSWGGYLTLMAVTRDEEDPPLFSCAVAGAAIADWFIQQAETEVRSYDHWLMGGWVYEQRERAHARSPVNFVDRIRVPLLVYHGRLDRDVPFPQIESFVAKARAAGVPVGEKFYPAEEHNLKGLENQADRLRRMRDFFRRHLQRWDFTDNPCGDQVP